MEINGKEYDVKLAILTVKTKWQRNAYKMAMFCR